MRSILGSWQEMSITRRETVISNGNFGLDRKGICSLEEFVLYQLATKVLKSRLKIIEQTIETHAYILIQSTCSTKLIISLFFKTEKSNLPILDENY